MPRRARLELPGVPLHIIQRGVNRGAVFVDDEDRRHYLHLLRKVSEDHGVAVHAYVLMGNHVHLLTSSQECGLISTVMHRLGQCYAQAFNRRHSRTGTFWESRFKSCLVDHETYLLTVYRYIELNPVRACMVDSPEQYEWSSALGNLGLRADPLLTPHEVFVALDEDSRLRANHYRDWLKLEISTEDLTSIRAYINQGKALGSARFQAMVERMLGRVVSWQPGGRPSQSSSN